MKKKIIVLIPCLNEEATIGLVIKNIRKYLPKVSIIVYDNNSSDKTVIEAKKYNVQVRNVYERGKGNVVRKMFSDNLKGDYFVMIDGDNTYDFSNIKKMINLMTEQNLDMVIGKRVHKKSEAYRKGHVLGNKLFTSFVTIFFGKKVTDIFSGFRIFSPRFIKTFPIYSKEFEIEAELTIHALDQRHSIKEVNCTYSARPEGSFSKLSTYSDGIKILKLILVLIKDERPLLFFSSLSLLFFLSSLFLGIPVIRDFYFSGLVEKLPSAILAGFLMLLCFISFFSGLVLDAIKKIRFENKQINYQLFRD